jgi:hypothetical protein
MFFLSFSFTQTPVFFLTVTLKYYKYDPIGIL